MRRRRAAVALWLVLCGCGEERTFVSVEISADRRVPDELDRLCCTARVDKQDVTALGYDAVGEGLGASKLRSLPATIVFEDRLDAHDELIVTATGTFRGGPAGFGTGLWPLVDGEQREASLRVHGCGPRRVVPFGLDGPVAQVPPTTAGPRRVALVDLDADGRAEIVEAPARVVFLSTTAPQELLFLRDAPLGATRLAVGDLDHDCAPDLLYASDASTFAPLVTGPGGTDPFGLWGPDERVGWPADAGGAIAIGDVDGSGAADVLVAGAGEYRVLRAATPRDGAVTFGTSSTYVTLDGEPDGVGSAVALADVTADGLLDAVVGHAGVTDARHAVRVFEGRAETLQEVPDALAVAEARDVAALAVGPLDGDDTPDVLVVFAGGGGPAAALYVHNADPGEPRFARAAVPVFPNGDGRDVALVDLDGDCDLDVVLAIDDGPSLVFEQTEDGLLETPIVLPSATAVAAGPSALGPDADLAAVVVLLDDAGLGSVFAAGVD